MTLQLWRKWFHSISFFFLFIIKKKNKSKDLCKLPRSVITPWTISYSTLRPTWCGQHSMSPLRIANHPDNSKIIHDFMSRPCHFSAFGHAGAGVRRASLLLLSSLIWYVCLLWENKERWRRRKSGRRRIERPSLIFQLHPGSEHLGLFLSQRQQDIHQREGEEKKTTEKLNPVKKIKKKLQMFCSFLVELFETENTELFQHLSRFTSSV